MTNTESTYLQMIKPTVMSSCNKYRICPSIIAMISILKSSFTTTREAAFARNLFNLTIDNSWFGKCYSKTSGKIYNSRSECKEVGAILYRAYNNYNQSIEDYVEYIATKKRFKDGPAKYQAIINDFDYKSCIDKLVRAEFIQDQFRLNDSTMFIQDKLIGTIEKYELYIWDSEIEPEKIVEIQKEKEENAIMNPINIYRVRLDWERPDTQICASINYEDALKEAMHHQGYKVYINDDGEIFFDPWDNSEVVEPSTDPTAVTDIIPKVGLEIYLEKRAVYKDAKAIKPDKYVTGTFYFYDNTAFNKRAKITKVKGIKYMKPDPAMIYGYINIG